MHQTSRQLLKGMHCHTRHALATAFILAVLSASAFALTGGPDAFGYTFRDVNEAAGPVFAGVDISGTGAMVVVGDDTCGTATLGATFDFYGVTLTDVRMCSNGYISTDIADTGGDFSNDCPLPVAPSTGGGMRMYPLHDDLNLIAPGAGYYEYFASCPRTADRGMNVGCSIFMWNDVQHFSGGGQVWDVWTYLYDSGDIVYEMGPGNPETGSGSTTGIQDGPPPTTALNVACNLGASIPDSYVVHILAPNFATASCVANTPASPAGGDVIVDYDAMSSIDPTVTLQFEFSTDGGATYVFATPAAGSANPAVGVAVGMGSYGWDSVADGVGQMALAVGVLFRVTVTDSTSPNICDTAAFDVDNTALCQGLCGDCNGNGVVPEITDALQAAQIAAGIFAPTMMQMACCDVNSTSAVEVLDALLIAQDSAGLPIVIMCL